MRDRNLESLVQFHFLGYPKYQDGMFTSTFRSTATCAANNSDNIDTRLRKAKTLSRRPAAADFFVAPLYVHNTAARLLINRTTCL